MARDFQLSLEDLEETRVDQKARKRRYRREYAREYRRRPGNRDKLLACLKAYYRANRDKWYAYQRSDKEVEKKRRRARAYCRAHKSDYNRRRRERGDGAKRRARKRGLPHERVKPIEIFRRDRGRCCQCGVKTPWRLRGTHEDNAPEVDHVIPESKGGGYVRTNLRNLCRRCNVKKSAAVVTLF